MKNDLCVRSDELIASGIKLKDYLNQAIAEVSEDYIDMTHEKEISVDMALKHIQKYRNVLLCIKEICKSRNKF